MEERTFMQDKGRRGKEKPQIWRVWREGFLLVTEWGQRGGILQTTTEKFPDLDVGKSNERTAEQVAQEKLERRVEMKTREGYREVDKNWKFIGEGSSGSIDFMILPRNIRFYKPQNNLSSYLEKLITKGEAWFSRKRDGMMFAVSVDDKGTPRLYSSRFAPTHKKEPAIPWLDRFPELAETFELMQLPPKTILAGEMVADSEFDDLQYVGRIIQSLTPRALDLQIEHRPLCYCLWDIIFWDGRQLAGVDTYEQRFEGMQNMVYPEDPYVRKYKRLLLPETEQYKTRGEAIRKCKDKNWEGWVVIDPKSTYEDRAISFHGKNERPKECGKLKPEYEADFILRWDPDNKIGEWGKGKKAGGVGSFAAYLTDENGEETYITKVGGLEDADVKKYADPGICLVGQVKFTALTRDGSLQFPSFLRERTDKNPEDCTPDQLIGVRRLA